MKELWRSCEVSSPLGRPRVLLRIAGTRPTRFRYYVTNCTILNMVNFNIVLTWIGEQTYNVMIDHINTLYIL